MSTPTPILITGGRCLDPATGGDWEGDLYLDGGQIAPRPAQCPAHTRVIDAKGCVVTPGLIDVHVHLREPGGEDAETIASGALAAARGGVTTIVAMPNTLPPIDTPEHVQFVLEAGRRAEGARVLTSACLTRERAGREPAALEELAAAGAVAFTDDGCTVQDDQVMRVTMERASALGRPVMDHAQDHDMERQGGVMHAGLRSAQWRLPGIPAEAETRIVARDLDLARATGVALHIQHVSCGASVDLIAAAQAAGLPVTAEATPHHLWWCEDDIDPACPDAYKMNPPLRTAADRARLQAAMSEGILTLFATDHAPHPAAAKARGFRAAPFGVVGLETAVGATYTLLVHTGRMPLLNWLRAWTTAPAALLSRPAPSLAPGQPADVAVFDFATEWIVAPDQFASRSRNTSFTGQRLRGRAKAVVVDGCFIDTPWPACNNGD